MPEEVGTKVIETVMPSVPSHLSIWPSVGLYVRGLDQATKKDNEERSDHEEVEAKIDRIWTVDFSSLSLLAIHWSIHHRRTSASWDLETSLGLHKLLSIKGPELYKDLKNYHQDKRALESRAFETTIVLPQPRSHLSMVFYDAEVCPLPAWGTLERFAMVL